jgi:hypothetical protein
MGNDPKRSNSRRTRQKAGNLRASLSHRSCISEHSASEGDPCETRDVIFSWFVQRVHGGICVARKSTVLALGVWVTVIHGQGTIETKEKKYLKMDIRNQDVPQTPQAHRSASQPFLTLSYLQFSPNPL